MFQFSHFLFSHSCGYISADNQFVNRDIQQSIFLSRSGSSEISGHLPQNYYYAVEGSALLCLCVFKFKAKENIFMQRIVIIARKSLDLSINQH